MNLNNKTVKLPNGWDLVLDRDYSNYVIYLDTHQPAPNADTLLLLGERDFNQDEYPQTVDYFNFLVTKYLGNELDKIK
jgi:hypothetical protein